LLRLKTTGSVVMIVYGRDVMVNPECLKVAYVTLYALCNVFNGGTCGYIYIIAISGLETQRGYKLTKKLIYFTGYVYTNTNTKTKE